MKPSQEDLYSSVETVFGFQHSFDPIGYSKGKSHFQQAFSWVQNADKRLALDSLYAFCRLCDDLSDEGQWPEEARRHSLVVLRQWVKGNWRTDHPFWTKWATLIDQFSLSRESLEEIITGVEMDFITEDDDWIELQTWKELEAYADRVAGAVGLCVLHILSKTRGIPVNDYAIKMGRCVQYLNIMRDLKDDLKDRRIYIPQEFLKSHKLSLTGEWSDKDLQIIRDELFGRAENYFNSATAYSWSCLPAEIMVGVYLNAARKYWRSGQVRKLSKSEKSKAAFSSFYHFMSSRRPA